MANRATLNPPVFDEGKQENDGGAVPDALLQPQSYFAGRYFIVSLLALGGMAEVYEAWDMHAERACALKILRLQHRRSEKICLQMAAEARALAAMDHPSIVEVWDGGATPEGLIYFAMELLHGSTLHDAIYGAPNGPRPPPVPLRIALDWIAQLARAVHALHLARIVHRDLKPDNIFVTREGRVVVLDLGAAKFRGYGLKTTGGHKTIGTPPYMSPEHLAGDPSIDGRSDVYSLGHVFYELLAQEHAFGASTTAHDGETYRLWQEQRRPRPLTEKRSDLPALVSELVLRALEKKREDRWKSCEEMAFAADGVSHHLAQEGLLDEPAPPAKPAAVIPRIALATTAESVPGRPLPPPVVVVHPEPASDPSPASSPRRLTKLGTEILDTAEPSSGAPGSTAPPAPPASSAKPAGLHGTIPMETRATEDPSRAAVQTLLQRIATRALSIPPVATAPARTTETTTLEVVTTETRVSAKRAGPTAEHAAKRRRGSERPVAMLVLGLAFVLAVSGGVSLYLARSTRAALPAATASSTSTHANVTAPEAPTIARPAVAPSTAPLPAASPEPQGHTAPAIAPTAQERPAQAAPPAARPVAKSAAKPPAKSAPAAAPAAPTAPAVRPKSDRVEDGPPRVLPFGKSEDE